MKKKIAFLSLVLLLVFLAFYTFLQNEVKRNFFAMDTVISLKIKGFSAKKSACAVEKEILRLHDEYSVNGNGALNIYNECKEETEELSFILRECERIKNVTGGAFDAGIYPVTKLWGFTKNEFKVPSEKEVNKALEYKGEEVDLGAIAKGYGADRVKEILSSYKIKNATVALGGTVLLYGNEERKVAIASPDKEGYAAYITAENCIISTSGGYERYFSENGEKYSHIIDPETGYPAKSGILSATVISESGTESDAFSTAAFVMGEKRAKELWEKENFGLILITEDGRMLVTEDVYPSISKIDEKYEVEIWERE